MNSAHAQENLQVIRDIMEKSARYTSFSGLSGVIAGCLALFGCWLTYWIAVNSSFGAENGRLFIAWLSIFILAVGQDLVITLIKRSRRGESGLPPVTVQVLKAVLPGVFVAFLLSYRAMTLNELDAIPALWALGYGVAVSAAGMFSIKEVRVFGLLQIVTGAVGLFLATPAHSLLTVALSFGLYHIIFGIYMSRKYGW